MTEEKKTVRAKKGDGHSGLFLEVIFQSIRSFVDGTIESVHQAARRFAQNVMRKTAAFFFFLLGFAFIFVGFAKLLNAVFPIPGIGESTIGVFMLILALVLYAFSQDE
jgi:uncharacterized membrane protein YkvI